MTYCHKCGTKLENEDVFCPNCGTEKVNSSNGNEESLGGPQENNPNVNKISDITAKIDFKNVLNILLNMLTKPVATSKSFINETEKDITIVLTVFVIIIQGFLGMWRVNQIISSIDNIIMSFITKITAIASLIQPGYSNTINSSGINSFTSEIDRVKSIIKIPYGKIFLQNCVLILISIAIIFIIICLGNIILSKNKGDTFKIYKTALIITIPTLYFQLFSIIISYISINLGIAVALFGFIIALSCFSVIIKESLMLPENYTVFVVSISALLNIIVIILCLQSFISSDVGNVVYSIINAIKNVGL